MKIICFVIMLLSISCNGQQGNEKTVSNIEEKINMKTETISFDDWLHSTTSVIQSDSFLEGFERENVLKMINKISENEFYTLQKLSNEIRLDKNFQEFFIFHHSEGEVIEFRLFYFYSNEVDSKVVSLKNDISEMKLTKPTDISLSTFKGVDVLSLSNDNLYQDIVVLTKKEGGNIVSKVGNPNKILSMMLLY